MKKRLPTLLATLIGSAIYSQYGLADDLMSQCMLGVPEYTRPLVQGDTNNLPVTIKSDKADGNYPDNAVFNGNVDVQQGNSRLQSDEIQLHQKTQPGQTTPVRTVDALGHVHYDDNQVILRGPKAWSNLNTKDTNVWNGKYQMVGRQGRGDGDQMKLRGNNRYTILENGSFTTCLPGSNSWSVVGSEIIHDREEQLAEIWNARFKIGSVPVFYSPYLQLPVGDRRRSGFLIPNIKFGNTSGFEFALPYYWNIAPQADATITPHYIEKRGFQLQNEFRYLTGLGTGLMEFDYMGTDKVYRDNINSGQYAGNPDSSKRWMFYWLHNGVYDKHWRLNVDYTRVSDPYYFSDLDSTYGNSTDGYATQKFSLGYADTNWDATLSSKQFQVFQINSPNNVYRAEPQLDLNYYKNNIGPFDSHIYAQAVKFTNVNGDYPDATRLHIEPSLNLPLSNGWASLNTETRLMATHYQQNDIDWYNSQTDSNNQLRGTVNRVMPQFKTDGKLVFDRDMNWSPGYTQTLEPRLQYLYIPYRNQSNINIYDSTLLQSDYSGLFRDRTYSGLDRIASANQLTSGVTTRIYDDNLVERFNASIGQIYSFTPSRTGVSNSYYDANKDNTGSVVWAGDSYWKISDFWSTRGGLQYDDRLSTVTTGNAVLEYRRDADRMIQLNYRYTSPKYIQATLPNIQNPGYQQGISQVGTTASWPIADAWSVVGAWYYDTKARQPADQLLGIQYSSCCYAIRIGYERKITNWDYTRNESKYDNKISFNIELRGLSPDYSLGTDKMLRQGILPYQPAF
ncbi:LPS assembly protein LptD [Erwinia sp. OLTSP20]|uniref:LPS assembly protein LptD n=1 Tax=unclassified Erwinia TaxID=2622719 RepID=UPI000C19DB98|nr:MULTISPECIES: LPS assembly protein LptD [unclassified Erwinia]PIJ49726.1 LPS assembly protein LptD [Erwinia sp. OAMSP11]PIJ70824.1 LPS assembly protein LptD [Erwinia sp. OLSSP12]PIJ80190.1 LPS assembly protein LptD [Erwinia sp. OLCASP19]PIJ82313.1 LPS assembly protein LptD [Erwinia sp. OLMTSP26]PIJ85000.1 LPS assembly protein LptD [Erwinia sp. OLMDSP33]